MGGGGACNHEPVPRIQQFAPFLVPTAPLVQMLPTKGRFAWVFLGVYTVLGETTRNPSNTMVKRAVAVVERCTSCPLN